MDCNDFEIEEVYPFDPDLWSFKSNGLGLRYKIGICIATGLIVWLKGPYKPQRLVDISIFWHQMRWQLRMGEWIVGNRGYRDSFNFVIPKGVGPAWLQEMMGMATARHETINSRLKTFRLVWHPYRFGQGNFERLTRHKRTITAICNVVNIWLVESPAFQLDYDDSGCLEFLV